MFGETVYRHRTGMNEVALTVLHTSARLCSERMKMGEEVSVIRIDNNGVLPSSGIIGGKLCYVSSKF